MAGLSQINTTHYVRASTITSLHQAGVDSKQICSIASHKHEQSLTPYEESSSSQKRALAGFLSRHFTSNKVVDGSSSMNGGEVNVSFATSETRQSRQWCQTVNLGTIN